VAWSPCAYIRQLYFISFQGLIAIGQLLNEPHITYIHVTKRIKARILEYLDPCNYVFNGLLACSFAPLSGAPGLQSTLKGHGMIGFSSEMPQTRLSKGNRQLLRVEKSVMGHPTMLSLSDF